jgi:hypothetical protein
MIIKAGLREEEGAYTSYNLYLPGRPLKSIGYMKVYQLQVGSVDAEGKWMDVWLYFPIKFWRKNLLNFNQYIMGSSDGISKRPISSFAKTETPGEQGQILHIPHWRGDIKYWTVTRYIARDTRHAALGDEIEVRAWLEPSENLKVIEAIDFYKKVGLR